MLDEEIDDLTMGTGLGMVYRNRVANVQGFSHGGVAIVYRQSSMSIKEVRLHNLKDFEVVAVECTLKGNGRKLVAVGCYLPPNYAVPRARQAMEFIGGVVMDAKICHNDPLVLVAGDFNQWRIEEALRDFPDLVEHGTGNTRGDHRIDRSFSNLPAVRVSGTLPPLETDHDPDGGSRTSDHKVAFFQADLPKSQRYEVLTLSLIHI